MSRLTPAAIAVVCHEANRALCEAQGDTSQVPWEQAPEWQKESAIKGVEFSLANPDAKPSDSHDSWLREKEATGWKFGPVKDAEKKEHPCFVPYEQLPIGQQAKDHLFQGVVRALRGLAALALLLCLFPMAALAQAPDPAALDALPILLQALSQGPAGVGLAVAAGILLLVQVVRTYGAKLHPVLADGRVAVALAILGPVVGAIVVTLSAGAPLTLSVILNAILAGLTASGIFSAGKALVAKAEVAGDAAAGAIGGKAAAVALLDAKAKGGQQ